MYTFGYSFWVNENTSQMSISLSGISKREARYLRVKLLYTDQNTY